MGDLRFDPLFEQPSFILPRTFLFYFYVVLKCRAVIVRGKCIDRNTISLNALPTYDYFIQGNTRQATSHQPFLLKNPACPCYGVQFLSCLANLTVLAPGISWRPTQVAQSVCRPAATPSLLSLIPNPNPSSTSLSLGPSTSHHHCDHDFVG